METQFRASVIIASYNGAGKISGVLQALTQQTVGNFEVIVVIDGSTDETGHVVEKYSSAFSSLRVITQANAGRSAARNRGASASTSDVLVFFDDDMLPEHGCVEAHCLFQERTPCLLCGDAAEPNPDIPTDFLQYKKVLTERWTAPYASRVTEMKHEHLFFSAANSSVHRMHFNALSGFDARLRDAEDYDLAYRAIELGIPVFYDKSIAAVHNDIPTCVGFIRRQRAYASAHEELARLHPARVASRQPLRQSPVAGIIYALFSNPAIPVAIDNGVFSFLPTSIRYKLYDVVIHSLSRRYPEKKV